ncbi:MAG: UDP-glucose/GDP-mannose dehydrogenase family protein [Bacteroidales bacterium]|nr:UDP-glucose/GDP-mannose dehydrogenase family protein [Bacteroidales bacterium]
MKISVVGTGYVGLVTGTCFAETGVNVCCVDIDQQKIDNLKNGIVPIYEPGLDAMIEKNVEKKRLWFSTDINESIVGADVAFISVGTPPDEDGSADLKYVLEVARSIGKTMDHYMVVVTKSTVPVGTAEKVRGALQAELDKRGVDYKFDVASNPEFLKEGDAILDFMKPDRIVIGTDTEQATEVMRKLYKPFLLNNHPILFMDIPSAELTKYAANAMLATRISFMNEIAQLCEKVGADVNSVRRGIGSDTRIGSKFLYAGTGYGGSCFPKDVKALIRTGNENGVPMNVIQSVEDVNDAQKSILVDKLLVHFNGDIKGKTIALWGLAFKPNTDDMREAPALVIIEKLIEAGAKVKGYDPVSMPETKRRIGDVIEYSKDQYDAANDADAVLLVTEWNEFKMLNYNILSKIVKEKVIFDGRNIYEPKEVMENGFVYYGIGRRI